MSTSLMRKEPLSMKRDDSHYAARLFRGWDYVTLTYELTADAMIVRDRHLWGGGTEKRVPYDGLSGDISHVLARQPAYRFSLLIAAIAAMALALEFAAAFMMSPGRPLYQPLWISAWIVGLLATAMFLGTRRRRMWSHFKGKTAHAGAFILQSPKDETAHARFVKELKRRIDQIP